MQEERIKFVPRFVHVPEHYPIIGDNGWWRGSSRAYIRQWLIHHDGGYTQPIEYLHQIILQIGSLSLEFSRALMPFLHDLQSVMEMYGRDIESALQELEADEKDAIEESDELHAVFEVA